MSSITDVPGVAVGHCTLDAGAIQTGVTLIRPHPHDVYRAKVPAASCVINGFGKSIGLLQVDELGVLETPIAMTNTFSVGTIAQAQIRAAIEANPQIGREWASVNPLVFECNDGYLNDMQAFAVDAKHYANALGSCGETFERGAVGAGRGMSCFELKGGIGSASCVAEVSNSTYAVGALVLANFGKLPQLTIKGDPVGQRLHASSDKTPEQGSIIMILATDAPLDARQLRRLAMRSAAGLARTGSSFGHGSGDIALAFSTAYTVPHDSTFVTIPPLINDTHLDPLFNAAADSIEHAILDALYSAETVTGRDGHRRISLREAMKS